MPSVARLVDPEIGANRPPRDTLPGCVMRLDVAPNHGPIPLRQANMLHGLVTALTRAPHLDHQPRFALIPEPSASSGWSVYVPEDSIGLRMAQRREVADLGKYTIIAQLSAARRIPAPSFSWAWSTVEIRTLTPMILRRTETSADGKKRKRYRLDFGNLLSTLVTWTPTRCGVAVWAHDARFGMRVLREECRVAHPRVNGKVGRVSGLEGRIVARVCPATRWLLEACQVIGIGGRVAYGFGRIVVRDAA